MNALSICFTILNSLIILHGVICSNEVPRPRGVPLSRLSLYPPDKDFTCLDNSITIPFTQVNDDYCDCADGSDEPGTSACPDGKFHCTNAGHKPMNIPSSMVNDGICDCCDASDEYARPDSNCVNNCLELGKSAMIEAQKRLELRKIGAALRADYSKQGVAMKQEKKLKLEQLDKNKEEAEAIKKEKEKIKEEIEKLENAALESYRKIEEEERKFKESIEAEKNKQQATEIFNKYDSNSDGRVDLSEIQTRAIFDRNYDGIVQEEEAKYYLDGNDAVGLDEFINNAWPRIKPFEMSPPAPKSSKGDDQEKADIETDGTDYDEHTDGDPDVEEPEDDEDLATADKPSEYEPSSEAPAHREYDEDTQKLIDAANEARSEFTKASKTVDDIEREIRSLRDFFEIDYGVDLEFAPLHGQCFEYTDREYTYKLCPFNQVTQQSKSGGMDTRLGAWGHWDGPAENKYTLMVYEQGAACWNGPTRSTKVQVNCGSENQLVSVIEPNRCEYVMEFSTPAACSPTALDDVYIDRHDEL